MAVRTSTFEIAALEADAPAHDADENVVEIKLGAKQFSLWRRPSAGQFATLQVRLTRRGSGRNEDAYRAVDRFLGGLMLTREEAIIEGRTDEDGVSYAERVEAGETVVDADSLWDLYEDQLITLDTITSLMRKALEVHSGFPTESAPDSSPGPKASGTPSTATSRRNRSTPSD